MTEPRRQRVIISAGSKPKLPRHARLRFDDTRQRWVILAPERVLAPDDIAVEVLQLCNGTSDVDSIAAVLAEKYTADISVIRDDVIAMLQDLADKGFLVVEKATPP